MKQFNMKQPLFAAALAVGLMATTAASAAGQQAALKLQFDGGYVMIPATHERIVRSGDGTITQVNLRGPVEIHYVDAADQRSRDIVSELGVGAMIEAISYPQ